jgi:AraC-like DNA-binding protein
MAALAIDGTGVTVETRESDLGCWTTAFWSPTPGSPLLGCVERIWYFEGTMTYPRERVFPDGRAELVVMLDEPHRDGDDANLPLFPAICINGMRMRPSVVVSPAGRCRVLGVRLEPAAASRMLNASMKTLVDVTVDLRDAMGRAAAELGERCFDASVTSAWNAARNAAASVSAARAWAADRLGGDGNDPAVDWMVRKIRRARGVISLEALGLQIGVARPRLAQRFSERVGVTPKRFARTVRFHNALSLLGRNGSIAGTAAELEYFDQSHLYRDFAEFARMTPAEVLAARRYPGSASLAEA